MQTNGARRFTLGNIRKVNALNECQLSTIAAQAWLNMRLQFIGVCIIGGVCAITILQRNFVMVHAGKLRIVALSTDPSALNY